MQIQTGGIEKRSRPHFSNSEDTPHPRAILQLGGLVIAATLVLLPLPSFAQSNGHADGVKDAPDYLLTWLNDTSGGISGLTRRTPQQELSAFIDRARGEATTSREMKQVLDTLFGQNTPAEQQMFDQAQAANDQARLNQIRNMIWSRRLKTLLPQIEAAAARGDVVANVLLGFWYGSPDGPLPFDAKKTIEYTEAAAKQGNPAACAFMGDIWSMRDSHSLEERGASMKHYYEEALSKGSLSALTTLVPFYMAGGLKIQPTRPEISMYAVALGAVRLPNSPYKHLRPGCQGRHLVPVERSTHLFSPLGLGRVDPLRLGRRGSLF